LAPARVVGGGRSIGTIFEILCSRNFPRDLDAAARATPQSLGAFEVRTNANAAQAFLFAPVGK
jgi:hypothetical protein